MRGATASDYQLYRMKTLLLPPCWGIALGLLLGCHPVKPEVSIEGAPQACCLSADPTLQNFKGCRIPRRRCKSRQGEKFWMRGAVSCGPVDEQQCEGGRCCAYQQQYDPNLTEPIENWAPPGHEQPTNNVTDPDAPAQHDLPPPAANPAPAPATEDAANPASDATPETPAANTAPEAPAADTAPVTNTPAEPAPEPTPAEPEQAS